MSSSASEGLAPASGELSGKHGAPPGPGNNLGFRVLPNVALPASEAGDAGMHSPLTPGELARLYRVDIGVASAPPGSVDTAERPQEVLAMRPILSTVWAPEQRQCALKRLKTVALLSADFGTGETVHITPGTSFGSDRAF